MTIYMEVDRVDYHGFCACIELFSYSFYPSEWDGGANLGDAKKITKDGGSIKNVIEAEGIGSLRLCNGVSLFEAIKVVRL